MRLKLQNIGKLSKAEIDLDGITIIAGENNTGKSTVGRTLYAVFNCFNNVDNRLEIMRKESITRAINNFLFTFDFFDFHPISLIDSIIAFKDDPSLSAESIQAVIKDFLKDHGTDKEASIFEVDNEEVEKSIKETSVRVFELLNISKDNLFKNLLERAFDAEFRGQICNFYSEGKATVNLTIKNETVTVDFAKNRVSGFEKRINLWTEAVYIDDPYILDNAAERYLYNRRRTYISSHRTSLIQKLRNTNNVVNPFDEIVVNKKLEQIYDKINTVCVGELQEDSRSLIYSIPGAAEPINIGNLSTGLKTFVILKSLLQNGAIGNKSTIILDEPEIHLHPAWQILFAEIIVLLQKTFDMSILINTHSPYFLEAIQVYAEKYGIEEKCKYYLAESKGDTSEIDDVTEHPEMIYKKLAQPFQILEDERFSDD